MQKQERCGSETWKINLPLGCPEILLTPLWSTILVAPSKFFPNKKCKLGFDFRPKDTNFKYNNNRSVEKNPKKMKGNNWLTSKVDHQSLWYMKIKGLVSIESKVKWLKWNEEHITYIPTCACRFNFLPHCFCYQTTCTHSLFPTWYPSTKIKLNKIKMVSFLQYWLVIPSSN